MKIDLTQSDLLTLTAALDLHRAQLLSVVLTTTGLTNEAAELELIAQLQLRERLQPETERAQFYWCQAPRSVWDGCHRGCWPGCNHINYAVQHTAPAPDRSTGAIVGTEN